MKKLKYISLLLIVMLLAGCGSKDGSKLLEEALTNMENVESGTIETKMSVAIEGYALGINLTTNFADDGSSYTKSNSTVLGMSFTSETYTVVEGDTVYTYSTEDGEEWVYETVPLDEYTSGDIDIDNVGGFAKNYKSVKQVKSDRKGETKLEVIVDKDKMTESLASEQELGSEADLTFDEDLTMYVYIKDGYITGLTLDLTDAMSDTESLTSYSMEFTISNHNKMDKIEVPENIKKNAVKAEETVEE